MATENDELSWESQLEACQQAIDYRFNDLEILRRCLTHSSSAPTRLDSNERLEFLGDAVLGLVVCDFLFERFPERPEGELTRIKSVVVSRTACAEISVELGLAECLKLGKGIEQGSGHRSIPSSILAAVFEAVVAGVYHDGGYESARAVIENCLAERIDQAADAESRNYKHLLQQIAQKRYGEIPVYQLLDEQGPDHAKCFQIAAKISDETFPAAWGPTKKEAEQLAAQWALELLRGDGKQERPTDGQPLTNDRN